MCGMALTAQNEFGPAIDNFQQGFELQSRPSSRNLHVEAFVPASGKWLDSNSSPLFAYYEWVERWMQSEDTMRRPRNFEKSSRLIQIGGMLMTAGVPLFTTWESSTKQSRSSIMQQNSTQNLHLFTSIGGMRFRGKEKFLKQSRSTRKL
jgi:hypothetical protein